MNRETKKIERIFAIPYYLIGNKYFRKLPIKLILRIFWDFYNIKITKVGKQYVGISFVPPVPSIAFDRAIMSFLDNKDSLYNARISLTNKCPNNCEYCSNKFREGREMSLEEVKKAIGVLQEKKLSVIGFTGGEPLLRKDLVPIIESVGDKSASYIFTSGVGLDLKKAIELKNAGLFGIAISLDSNISQMNDSLRGKDSFNTAINAINISKKAGLYTIVQTVVTKKTFGNLINFLKFLKKLNVDEVMLLEIIPCGKMLGKKDEMLDKNEKEKLKKLHLIANKRKDLAKVNSYPYAESDKYLGCAAGYNILYIDASGEVYPCDMTPLSFGNIIKEDFPIIWERLKKVFPSPSTECLFLENYEKIYKRFNGKLPFSYEVSKEICKNHCPKRKARYYRLLEGK